MMFRTHHKVVEEISITINDTNIIDIYVLDDNGNSVIVFNTTELYFFEDVFFHIFLFYAKIKKYKK
jgi:hypothetical protein